MLLIIQFSVVFSKRLENKGLDGIIKTKYVWK